MVEIFKTDISRRRDAEKMIGLLRDKWLGCRVSIDLDDCDKVLRLEAAGSSICPSEVISFLARHDFNATILE